MDGYARPQAAPEPGNGGGGEVPRVPRVPRTAEDVCARR